jgi:hypothetical protein
MQWLRPKIDPGERLLPRRGPCASDKRVTIRVI